MKLAAVIAIQMGDCNRLFAASLSLLMGAMAPTIDRDGANKCSQRLSMAVWSLEC